MLVERLNIASPVCQSESRKLTLVLRALAREHDRGEKVHLAIHADYPTEVANRDTLAECWACLHFLFTGYSGQIMETAVQ